MTEFMTAVEAAREMKQTPAVVRALCAAGVFDGAVKDGRQWRIPLASVALWRAGQASSSGRGPRNAARMPVIPEAERKDSYSVKEAAALCGIHPSRVRARCAQGQIPGARLDDGEWRIPHGALLAIPITGQTPDGWVTLAALARALSMKKADLRYLRELWSKDPARVPEIAEAALFVGGAGSRPAWHIKPAGKWLEAWRLAQAKGEL